jgi:hypothetical protein
LTYLVFLTRATLLLVFAAALIGKAHSASAWSNFVAATKSLLGVHRTAEVWAAAAVTLEAATFGCLMLNTTAYVGLWLAFVGLAEFLAVVVNGVRRGVETSCNCFGSEGTTLGWSHVWRNALLLCVAALGVGAASFSEIPSILLTHAAYATPTVLSVITAAVFVMWDDVSFLAIGPARQGITSAQERG